VGYILLVLGQDKPVEPNFVATGPKWESGPHHACQFLGHVVDPLFHLVEFFIDFFFSRSSISQKIMWQKDWVRLKSRRSLKVKNMQKQGNLLRSVKTK
jgi:hypothetical protein